MKPLFLDEIVKVTNGKIVSKTEDNPVIKKVVTRKSHSITDSSLIFFPRKSILNKHLKLKSCVIITQKPDLFQSLNQSYTIVKVKSSHQAFKRFISYYRNLFNIDVIGITGTCGKTTTKEMVSCILEEDKNVVKTILSKNSRSRNIDYLMKLDDTTDAAVIEVGVGFPGGIRNFAEYFKPAVGVITNIGTDHMKGFKTQEAYVKEKSKMIEVVNPGGTIILNKDDETIKSFDLSYFKGTIIYFGLDDKADIRASNIRYSKKGMDFTVHDKSKSYKCNIQGYGRHNVYNALAALAVASSLGITMEDAIQKIQKYQPIERHLDLHKGINECTLIDDTWNTNTKSVYSALEVLTSLANGRKTVAVIGDIEELGELSESEHRKIGSYMKEYNIDYLITIGSKSKFAAQQAIELGMNPENIYSIEERDDFVNLLKKLTDRNTIVLIKTSMRKSFKESLNQLIQD